MRIVGEARFETGGAARREGPASASSGSRRAARRPGFPVPAALLPVARLRGLRLPAALLCVALAIAACGGPGSDEEAGVQALSADSLHAWLTEGRNLVVLDTRPDSLFRAARIPGAVPAAARTIPDLREVLPTEPEAPVVFYSEDGSVPGSGADAAREAAWRYGFRRVYRLEGGIEAWIALGHEVHGQRPVSSPH